MTFIRLQSRLIFCFCMFFSISLWGEQKVTIEIEVDQTARNQQGELIHTVVVGKPFTIHIKVAGQSQGKIELRAPSYSSLQHFGTQTSFSSINGAASSMQTHSYQASVAKEGEATFGPAKVSINGTMYESKTVKVRAVKEAPSQGDRTGASTAKQPKDIFCRLTANKKNVVVGQTITLTLSIYLRGDIQQIGLEPYHFDGFLTKELPEGQRHGETIDGKQFVVLEKQFLLNPTEEGIKKIPPFTVVYERLVQDQSTMHNFFGMAMFGGVRSERGKATSNALEITVTKLPPFNGAINGVGSFSQFIASVDKNEVVANEPILLSLTVKGSAHFDQVTFDHPALPGFCKFYSSKSATSYDDQLQSSGTKKFDFVIQVGQTGSVELPAQRFTFFDAQSRSYKTLVSKPIMLTIKQGSGGNYAKQIPQQTQEEQPRQEEKEEKKEENSINDIHFIHEDFGQQQQIPAIPWWLFGIIIVSLLAASCTQLALPKKYLAPFASLFRRRNHEKKQAHIKKDIEKALHEQSAHALHQLFARLVCSLFDLEVDEFTELKLAQTLAEQGWQEVKIAEFLDFLNACASIRFGSSKIQQKVLNDVIEQATYWLLFLVK